MDDWLSFYKKRFIPISQVYDSGFKVILYLIVSAYAEWLATYDEFLFPM